MKFRPDVDDGQVSAWMDGELTGPEHMNAASDLLESPEAWADWHAYHVMRDVLRGGDSTPAARSDQEFLARLNVRLALEPQAPVSEMSFRKMAGFKLAEFVQRAGANADFFGKIRGFGMACTLLLAVLVGTLLSPRPIGPDKSRVGTTAENSTGSVAISEDLSELDSNGMIRDPGLDQLLNAHRQLGGHSALQKPAGFLRNATFEGAR
jgi:sigma-E factor negative regulatory protein RseA